MALALLLGGAVYLLHSAIGDTPWVTASPAATAEQVYAVKSLAKRTLGVFSRQQEDSISVSQTELDSLSSLLSRAYPKLHSQLTITPAGLELKFSAKLPSNPLGPYLSWQLVLPVSEQQVSMEQLRLGNVIVPDALLQSLLPGLLQVLFDQEQRQTLLQTVRLSALAPEQLTLSIRPPTDADKRLRELLARIHSFSGVKPAIDNSQISHYYGLLQQQSAEFESQQWVSVTQFIAPLFRQVAQQTDPEQLHLASGSALLALAIYLGSDKVEQLTGPVITAQQRQQPPHHRTLLQGRIDLRQHFVVSAALQVLADAGASHAIGEFKELLDSRQGGSGFSFADLAADRAGTLFAVQASRDPHQAQAFLQRLEQPLRETDLMIAIDQLPEGLSEQQFAQRYQDFDDSAYKEMLLSIDNQLKSLRLYKEAETRD